ncbi:MAG: cytochrome P450, partial [Phaeodactylibacter sp.]|nr:cytochrome P450 [Phaeodactylibacter sp.]
LQFVERTVHDCIAAARQRLADQPELQEKPGNLLEMLLTNQSEHALSDAEIYGNVFTMLLAGEDTTANSLAWAAYYLSLHPEMVAKIRAEGHQVYGAGLVAESQEQLAALTYTHAFVQEVFRLKPVSPQLLLEAAEDTVVQQLHLPKGTRLLLQNQAAPNSSRYFSDPDQCIPERWLATDSCPIHHPEVIRTFGAGPRFCPGKYLATNEMVLLIAALCKRFDLELAGSPAEVRERLEFTMYPEGLGIVLRPVSERQDGPGAL